MHLTLAQLHTILASYLLFLAPHRMKKKKEICGNGDGSDDDDDDDGDSGNKEPIERNNMKVFLHLEQLNWKPARKHKH